MAKILPHVEMRQVFGRISVSTQNATQTIRQPKAGQSIQQPKAEMTIDRESAHVQIDQSAGWHNLDLKSARIRIAEAADAGKQAVLEGIARHSQEGDELLHIERNKGRNLFAKQAADRVNAAVIGTRYSTGDTPASQAVSYDVIPATLQVNWRTQAPIIQATINAPEYSYQPGRVNISMEQYPSLDIWPVGIFIDEKG
ncbi:DUF6470 family protein [Sporolactobacillus shoreicorticis]|uniref:DUF6470 family protein n=1 Tax=Sporolactobacillus shoreicorticis TaxID=1923877 RepID=A0ABW5S042_9BACL|nr:DUF6470 family protein [Sporolactobacillus shoreicorticis]MCO7124995.1 DUF6470 family protein [Sporolactobacillus shoreicorticis]